MDWITLKKNCVAYIGKYRYVIAILLIGLILLCLPTGKRSDPSTSPAESIVDSNDFRDLEDDLAVLLSKVSGAGKVEVLLTQSRSSRTIYQTDESINSGQMNRDERIETVLVVNSDRSETGLIREVTSPIYQGAVILCQGAENAGVRLALVEAVCDATGLSSDKISVLKMK